MGFRAVEKMKKVAILISLLIFCCGIGKGIHWARKGFSLRRITAPTQMKLEIWDPAMDEVINQPFCYLGRGRQCFAFESFDGKYVLKFPRTDIYQIPFWMRTFPWPLFSKKYEKSQAVRSKREAFVLNSMKIAYDELRDETGVVGIHFGQSENKNKKITIVDPLGFSYRVPLHRSNFVLQLKRPILMKVFLEALSSGDREKGKMILEAFIDLVVSRGKKGIWNKDESFLRNYGFDGQKGVQIDIGSFYHRENGAISIRNTMHPVQTWLEKTDLEMLKYFNSILEEKIAAAFLQENQDAFADK